MERVYWARLMWLATVCSLLLLGPVAGQEQKGRATVYFSEVVPRNSETYKTEEGATPDLIELYNYGSGPVDLKGFVVSDKDSVEKGWTIPESAVIPAGGWLVLYADGSGRVTNEGLFPDFKLSGDGEELFLFDPQGNKVASMAFPMLGPDQSFGVAGGQQAGSADLTYRILVEPTPGAANAAAASTGPIVMVKDYEGPATGDIEVEMSVWSPDTSISKATLTYVVNYGDEVEIPMQEAGDGAFKATIPAQQPGDMVRWYVTATDGSGAVARAPQFLEPTSRKYFGTFMDDPSLATNLPVVHIYCENEKAPYTVDKETIPECSVMVNGKFYDNIIIRRRGVSSLNWPKPKFKVDAGEQGKIFEIFDSNGREVKEFNMNSGVLQFRLYLALYSYFISYRRWHICGLLFVIIYIYCALCQFMLFISLDCACRMGRARRKLIYEGIAGMESVPGHGSRFSGLLPDAGPFQWKILWEILSR